jgi:hypothetical protein
MTAICRSATAMYQGALYVGFTVRGSAFGTAPPVTRYCNEQRADQRSRSSFSLYIDFFSSTYEILSKINCFFRRFQAFMHFSLPADQSGQGHECRSPPRCPEAAFAAAARPLKSPSTVHSQCHIRLEQPPSDSFHSPTVVNLGTSVSPRRRPHPLHLDLGMQFAALSC